MDEQVYAESMYRANTASPASTHFFFHTHTPPVTHQRPVCHAWVQVRWAQQVVVPLGCQYAVHGRESCDTDGHEIYSQGSTWSNRYFGDFRNEVKQNTRLAGSFY